MTPFHVTLTLQYLFGDYEVVGPDYAMICGEFVEKYLRTTTLPSEIKLMISSDGLEGYDEVELIIITPYCFDIVYKDSREMLMHSFSEYLKTILPNNIQSGIYYFKIIPA
jgi:hypothetical protein